MQPVYVVIYREFSTGKWMPASGGVVDSRQLAEKYIELMKQITSLEYAIVEGPITNPRDMRQAELALGAF